MTCGNTGCLPDRITPSRINVLETNEIFVFGSNIQGMNIGGNQDWIQGYNTSNNTGNQNNSPPSGNKINCIFNTSTGNTFAILIDYGKTIKELITVFFKRVNKPELFNRTEDICFLYNANKININSQEKVENYFGFNGTPRISVNDTGDLIGA